MHNKSRRRVDASQNRNLSTMLSRKQWFYNSGSQPAFVAVLVTFVSRYVAVKMATEILLT
jgi:hypothetical protein